MGGHPSRPAVAGGLERSTRRLGRAALERLRRTAARRRPSRPCSGWGLPSHTGHPVCGGLLHRRFTLTGGEPPAVCSLWHCPAGHPGSPLTTTLPCGARTFLGDGVSPADATAQPTRPSCRQSRQPRQNGGGSVVAVMPDGVVTAIVSPSSVVSM